MSNVADATIITGLDAAYVMVLKDRLVRRALRSDFLHLDAQGVFSAQQACLSSDGAYLGIGAKFYSGSWRNTVASQGGAAIRNNAGVLSFLTGTSPGAAGTAFGSFAERMRLDGAGNLGIGATNLNAKLVVQAGITNKVLSLYDDATNQYGFGIGSGQLRMYAAAGAALTFGNYTRSTDTFTETMRLDASGNLGIGTNAPGARLHVTGGQITQSRGTGANLGLLVTGSDASSNYIRMANSTGTLSLVQGNAAAYLAADTAQPLILTTNGSERMRVEAGGNVGIGITSTGAKFDVSGNARFLSVNSGTTGTVILRDAVGNPGACFIQAVSNANDAQYSYLRLNDGSIVASSPFFPNADNALPLGFPGLRWSVVYAATGTINTSDVREKDWLALLRTDDWRAKYLEAARRIERELDLYRWIASVEEKGEDARWHFGARAQAVVQIFMDCGLEAKKKLDLDPAKNVAARSRPSFRHAFLCFDSWADEHEKIYEDREVDGDPVQIEVPSKILDASGQPIIKFETVIPKVMARVPTGKTRVARAAGNRFGFRTDQLLLFLAACNGLMRNEIEARLNRIEAQLAS